MFYHNEQKVNVISDLAAEKESIHKVLYAHFAS